MADESVGALSTLGGRDVAKNLAYGGGNSNPLEPVMGALGSLLDPARAKDHEDKAYWAGMLAPTKSGNSGEQQGNALTAQVAAREASDKLKAAYIPMIMQAMGQNRANELGYAKFNADRMKEINPVINSALYGLQADGKTPDVAAAHQRINDIGMQYGMAPHELYPHHFALQAGAGKDGKNLGTYLQQLRVAAAPPAEGIGKFGSNAAGQRTLENQVAGRIDVPGQGEGETNPTKAGVDAGVAGQGNIKEFGAGLANNVRAFNEMSERVKAVRDQMKEFTPGRYSGIAGGFAAAMSDLQARFPNAATDTLKKFANALVSPDGKHNGIAAQQFAESIQGQESLAQVKTMLTGADGSSNGRVGQQEFMIINSLALGALKDPDAFKKFQDFNQRQYDKALKKYEAWGNYLGQTPREKYSVHAFDVPYSVHEAKALRDEIYGPPAMPGQPAAQPQPQAPRPAAPQAAPQQKPVDLSQYEPGAKIGPTGKVYVMTPQGPRAATPRRTREQSGKVIDLSGEGG